MWILIRIVAACCGFGVRYLYNFGGWKHRSFGGRELLEYVSTSKKKVVRHCLGVPFSGPAFVMTREASWDRTFKFLGLSAEFQTGDEQFDREIYIASDHPFFCNALRDSPEIRGQIRWFFQHVNEAERIVCNGKVLYIQASEEFARERIALKLERLGENLSSALAHLPGRFTDTFAWRALLVEAVVWSMAGYAIGALISLSAHHDLYLDQWRLITYGGLLGVIALIAILALIVAFLQRSSRSHRILVECALVLLLSLPLLGYQGVADYNRLADNAPPRLIETTVVRKWTEVHKRKRSSYHTYHIEVALPPEADGIQLPREIKLTAGVYGTLHEGQKFAVEVGTGKLGIPWYRKINGVAVDG